MSLNKKQDATKKSFSEMKKQIKERKDLPVEPKLSEIPEHISTLSKPSGLTTGYWFETDIDVGFAEASGTTLRSNAMNLNPSVIISQPQRPIRFTTIPSYTIFEKYALTGLDFLNWPNATQASKIVTIGQYALSANIFRTSLNLSSVVTISEYAFSNSTIKGSISFPSTLRTIGSNAFNYLNLEWTSITIPTGVTSVGNGAFSGINGPTTFTYDATTTTCPRMLLYNSPTIESATCSRATIYGDRNFSYCKNLKTVRLGDSSRAVTSIASNVFRGCDNLTSITIYVSNTTTGLTGAPWGATNATINYLKV